MLDEGIDYLVIFVHYKRGDITCICNYNMLTCVEYVVIYMYAYLNMNTTKQWNPNKIFFHLLNTITSKCLYRETSSCKCHLLSTASIDAPFNYSITSSAHDVILNSIILQEHKI